MIFKKVILFVFVIFLFSSCANKQPKLTSSATIIFKTPLMKFYDKGFINKYNNFINLQIYNLGTLVLNLNIYKNLICKSTFTCMSASSFNKKYLNKNYEDDFMYKLFSMKNIYFKDKKNHIFIKVKKD